MARLFCAVHHEPPLTAAAHSGLGPPPQGDPGGPHNLHHSYSTAVGRPAIIHPSHLPRSCSQTQQARNLLMDLGEQTHRVTFMIRDRGSDFTAAFDAVLADAGIRTVLCNVRTPRMNAIADRWIGGCRRELLDRALVWNQAHLRRILREYEIHHNQHRPHRSLHGATR